MHENQISKIIVDSCFRIHNKLGPGLLESVYEYVLAFELKKADLFVERQKPVSVIWDGLKFDRGFRADIIVDNKVLIEIKSVEHIAPVHKKQLLTYLRLTNLKLGILVNFNEALLKNGLNRIVNGL